MSTTCAGLGSHFQIEEPGLKNTSQKQRADYFVYYCVGGGTWIRRVTRNIGRSDVLAKAAMVAFVASFKPPFTNEFDLSNLDSNINSYELPPSIQLF